MLGILSAMRKTIRTSSASQYDVADLRWPARHSGHDAEESIYAAAPLYVYDLAWK